jgi:DNA polymerase-3 subunit gamma/tau
MELYRKHRPTKFSQVIGQPTAVRILTDLVRTKKIPHAVLFTGPSGCGKTTLARILTTKLNCLENDCCELNAADARGIDTIREIRRFMGYKAMAGSTRVWLLDEAHLLTNEAQSALLKILEDPPDHAYFMLCTTHEAKLLPTVRGRCTEVRVTSMFDAALRQLVETAAEKEGLTLSKELLKQIVECCDGSGRKALVLLEQIAGIEDEKERIDCILKADSKRDAIEIARALVNPQTTWAEIASLLQKIDEDPEKIRRLVLSFATTVLLNSKKGNQNAYILLTCFETDFFASGKAGLVRACYEMTQRRSK